ncbi:MULTISPECIES: hypothetical protein [unclassified Coleofasciculus]|uniref:hypothetical protein n=1 Tax=unclassified Coleofasciculus TaxID=2692782 RepID=UPI00188258EA|nr:MULTISPECIES: hypothetical protein [unclassified Coleofasciculus]MBE9125594.1 hypothetical protein [Coleofasciculus sp. LEGE 07081]MBE9147308.1 hypothetical protein [Coleofasciculus sp. LEGE 07092]
MVTVVVVFNVLISLLGFYVAWRVWKLRRVLARAADIVAAAERSTYAVLHGTPKTIYRGQLGVEGLRDRYQQLEVQLQRVQRVLLILGLFQRLGRFALRRNSGRSHSRKSRYSPRRP